VFGHRVMRIKNHLLAIAVENLKSCVDRLSETDVIVSNNQMPSISHFHFWTEAGNPQKAT
jgi:hypothetical protein